MAQFDSWPKSVADARYIGSVGHDGFAFWGQSNIQGGGVDYPDADYLDRPDPRIDQWPGMGPVGVMQSAREPLLHVDQVAGNIGPALSFGRRQLRGLAAGRKIALITGALGSSGFTPSSSAANGGSATYTWDSANTTATVNLFNRAIAQCQSFLAAYPGNVLKGIVWGQGENDIAMSASAYQAALLALIDAARSQLGSPNLPFIIIGMVPSWVASQGAGAQAIDAVHKAIPGLRQNVSFVPGATGAGMAQFGSNTVHYAAKAHRLNGFNAADYGLPAAIANVTGTAPVAPTSVTLGQLTATSISGSWVRGLGRATSNTVSYTVNGGAATTLTGVTLDPNFTITGLPAGATVVVSVSTTNEQPGTSSATTATITLTAAPGQTVGLAAGASGGYTQALSWTATAGASSYLVEYRLSGGAWNTYSTVTSNSCTVQGLVENTSYGFRVTPINAGGNGTVSAELTGVTTAAIGATVNTIATALNGTNGNPYGGAFGLRLLRGTGTKALIQVRRVSDGTVGDISNIAGTTQLDAATLATFSQGGDVYVSKFYGQGPSPSAFANFVCTTYSPSITTTSGSATVACASAVADMEGKQITGTGIPAAKTYIKNVVPGTGFTLSSTQATLTAANATASGTVTGQIGQGNQGKIVAGGTVLTTSTGKPRVLFDGTCFYLPDTPANIVGQYKNRSGAHCAVGRFAGAADAALYGEFGSVAQAYVGSSSIGQARSAYVTDSGSGQQITTPIDIPWATSAGGVETQVTFADYRVGVGAPSGSLPERYALNVRSKGKHQVANPYTRANGGPLTPTTMCLGATYVNGSPANFWNGDFCEMVAFMGFPGDLALTAVEQNQMDYWGIV